jgi:hypothetical protein
MGERSVGEREKQRKKERGILDRIESTRQEIMRANWRGGKKVLMSRNLDFSQRVSGKWLNILSGEKMYTIKALLEFSSYSIYFIEREIKSHCLNLQDIKGNIMEGLPLPSVPLLPIFLPQGKPMSLVSYIFFQRHLCIWKQKHINSIPSPPFFVSGENTHLSCSFSLNKHTLEILLYLCKRIYKKEPSSLF